MGRIPRFTRHDQPTVYHIMSRTALDKNGDKKGDRFLIGIGMVPGFYS